jgi:Muconolactone delta-isomerase
VTRIPQYQVTMSLEKADPLLDLGDLTEIVEQAILPSLRALEDLQSKGKILAGGHPVGQRYIVMFMDAESEDEVRRLLRDLPLSELGKTYVTELNSFEEPKAPPKEPGEASYRKRMILP